MSGQNMKPVMCKARECVQNPFQFILKYFDKGLCFTAKIETFMNPYEIRVGQLILLKLHEFSIKAKTIKQECKIFVRM